MQTQTRQAKAIKTGELALLLRLMSPYKALIAGLVVTLMCDITGMLVIPTQLSALLNTAITTRDMAEVARHGIIMLVAALVGSGGNVISYRLAARLAANVGRDLRCEVYRKSLELSGYEFGQLGAGSMITRTLSDANVVQQTIMMSFVMISPVPVTCVIATIMAFGIDPVMGWLLLAVIVLTLGAMAFAVWKSAPVFTVLQGFIDRINTRLRESITGVRVIRAFGREPHERQKLDQTFEDYAGRAIRVNLVFATVDSLTFFFMNAVESAIYWVGADRVGAHAMQIGSISALVEYAMLIMFFMMMAQFCVLQIPRAWACLSRANEVLDIDSAIKDPAAGAAAAITGRADGEKPAQRLGELAGGLHLGLWRGGSGHGVAGGGHGLKRPGLVGGIALDGLHQVGDEVVPALELRVDGLPGGVALVVLLNDAVVDAHPDEEQDYDQGNDNDWNNHGGPP